MIHCSKFVLFFGLDLKSPPPILPPVVALGSPDAASTVTSSTNDDESLPELQTIFNDDNVIQYEKPDQTRWILCKWCQQEFKNPHSTRMLAHLV